MKKKPFLKLTLPLIFVFLALSYTFSHLEHEVTIDDEVAQLIRDAPSAESYPDAGIIDLLDENIVEVFEDRRYREREHKVFKILNERGKEKGKIEIGFHSSTETASVIYARTITTKGEILQLDENSIKVISYNESDYKEIAFSMPEVTVGSIIDYKVVTEEKKPTIEGIFSYQFHFQWYNPTFLCRYKVIAPEDMDLKYLVLNPLPGIQLSPRIIRNGNKKTYLWEYKHIPQIIEEKSMPPMGEVAFRILVTTMNSWEEFSYWWRKKVAGKTEPDESIKMKVAELTQNLSTSREKVEAIYDYVKGKIRNLSNGLGKSGYEPESAKKVFKKKYGDCKDKSTLLISMLRAARILAYYVLIPTNKVGNLIRDFPHPGQFNHCIVAVENVGEYHFIDPVAKNYCFDYLPGSDRNRDVLIFKDEKIIFTKTPLAKPEENAYHSQSQIKIGLDGSIGCEVKDFGFGGQEASLRSPFIDNRPMKYLKERIDEISSGAKLLAYTHSDPINFKERFELNFKYEVYNYCKKNGDILIFNVPGIRKSCPGTDKKDRRYPIVIWNNSYNKDEVEFNVPEGYEVYHLPGPIEIINQYFEFHSNYRQAGEKIFYQGELIRKSISIIPEEYPAYQESCQAMEKSLKRDVLFKAKEADRLN